jgi:magnesium-transporting ATPase (P-type)
MINQLSTELQNIVMFNYSVLMRFLLVGGLFLFSLVYLFYWKPYVESKTAFWSVMLARTLLTATSFFSLIMSPFLWLLLDPLYSYSDFLTTYFMIYLVMLLILAVVLLLDFYYWGFAFLAKMVNIDMHSEKYARFKRWVDTYLRH